MKTSRYFELHVRRNRPEIKIEWCEYVLSNAERTEQQGNGYYQMWAYIEEAGHYLRLITEPDGETAHNAFFDRGYERMKRSRE